VTLNYLSEYAEDVLLALALAKKEAEHLSYTQRTLFAQPIDLDWVESLPDQPAQAEKIDAYVARFGRLQDHIGEKLIPRFARLMGENPKSLLDALAFAEKMEWIDNAEEFIGARKLRMLVHEYVEETELFLQSLQTADAATNLLLDVVIRISKQAEKLKLR